MNQVRAQHEQRELPPAIGAFVREYTRQRRQLLFFRELLLILVLLMGWVTFCCLADRVLQLEGWARGALLALTVVGVGVWLGLLLRRSLLARITQTHAAMELELLRPDLDERLATVCSRLADPDGALASRDMLQAIAGQVNLYVATHGMPRMVSFRTVGHHAAGAVIMLGVVLGLSAIPTLGMPALLQRMVTPWLGHPPVTTTQLWLLQGRNGEIGVKEGETAILDVLAARTGGEGVTLHYSTDGTTWAQAEMSEVDEMHFQAGVGPLSGDEKIFFSAGDARTPVTLVRLLRKPAVAEFRLRYEYPAYMQREPFTITNTTGLIEAPVGTKATVSVVASDRLESAMLKVSGTEVPLTATADPTTMQGTVTVSKDEPYTIAMKSTRGLEGSGPPDTVIRALPDRAPFVRFVIPVEDQWLSPRDITQLRYEASDDYGVTELGLRVQVNSTQPLEMAVKRNGDPRRSDGAQELDLANLGLRIGDVVSLTFLARDGAGQSSTSETRYVFISPHSLNSTDYERVAELQRSLDLTGAVAKDIEKAGESLQAARVAKTQPDKRAEATGEYQQQIALSGEDSESLKQALTRAVSKSTDSKLNDLLATMADRAEVRMIEAHDLVDEVGKGEQREENAKQRLDRALEQTRAMQKQLEQLVAAERADAAISDRRNLNAAEEAQKTGRMTPRAAEMLSRMRQDLGDQIRQLGANPDDPNVDKQLQAKVDQGKKVAEGAKPVNMVEAAKSWSNQLMDDKAHPPMFDRRLAAASEVEAARAEGNLLRARDLNLASRAAQAIWTTSQDADPKSRQMADDARKQFAGALEDVEKHDAAAAKPNTEPEPAVVQAASAAREKMAKWAGDTDPVTGPEDAKAGDDRNRDLAMEANAEMAQRRYDRASELQKRMAMEQDQAAEAGQAMQEAQVADQLAQRQDTLRDQVAAAPGDAGQLAQQQREMARQIDAQARADAAQMPRDTRQEALTAIQAVQERLAQMPQQLQDVTGAADVQFQAHDLSRRLDQAAQTAAEPKKASAQRSAERAASAEKDARKETDTALVPVAADVANVMSAGLVDYLPETSGAAQVIDQRLAPALGKVKQAVDENKGQDLVRGVRQAREAIAEAQQELRMAQEALLDKDPLFAAKVYANAAADALSRVPPDVKAAVDNQTRASQALTRQWQTSMHESAQARLSGASATPTEELVSRGKKPANAQDLAAARQWGILRQREKSEASAPNRDEDPTGYNKMLQVYFRTLGKARGQEAR